MNGSGEIFLKWFPAVMAVLQVVVLPLLIVAMYYTIDARIAIHNSNLNAHPTLKDLEKLENRIEDLSRAVNHLQLAIERLTPRRKTDMIGGSAGD